jgi:hypothetical protein
VLPAPAQVRVQRQGLVQRFGHLPFQAKDSSAPFSGKLDGEIVYPQQDVLATRDQGGPFLNIEPIYPS